MLKLKKAKIQEEEIAKKRERDNFNNQCDYLNQLATVNKKHQQELIHSHHELLKNEWKKNNDQKVMNVSLFLLYLYTRFYNLFQYIYYFN